MKEQKIKSIIENNSPEIAAAEISSLFSSDVNLLLEKLDTKLKINDRYDMPDPKGSMMHFGEICDHDDGTLCVCRKNWLFSFIKSSLL